MSPSELQPDLADPLGVSIVIVEDEGVVVCLQGEHDVATIDELGDVLARAIALDDRAVVIDLSRIEFMSAATVTVIVRAKAFLQSRDRSLSIRTPSECARRTMVACGAADLLTREEPSLPAGTDDATALASWVTVSRSDEREASSEQETEEVGPGGFVTW
jgi:anti-anti-sigma factor